MQGAQWGKCTLSPETVCRFPSNLVGLIPRGLEPEVVHMGHVAPGGPRGRAPRVNNVAKFNLLVQIQGGNCIRCIDCDAQVSGQPPGALVIRNYCPVMMCLHTKFG